MDNLLTLTLVIMFVALVPFVFAAVIRFVRTDYVLVYKRFKKPVQTTGVIEWVECVNIPQGGSYYIVTYSYTDNMGERRTVAFRWHQRIGWPNDMIAIHFDSQDPESSIADCQVEYGRKVWRNTLIIFLATLVFAAFGLLYFFKINGE